MPLSSEESIRQFGRPEMDLRAMYGVWHIAIVKVTFELPSPLVQQLRAHVPSGERSKFVAELISRRLQRRRTALEEAAEKANTLSAVNLDMKAWEALNGYED